MIDQKKRNTLKAMAASGAVVAVSGAANAGAAAFGAAFPESPIQIDILTSTGVPGDTVIIKNTGSQALTIDSFQPGIVVYKNSMLDLNELCADGPVALQPGQMFSKTVAEWQLLALPMFGDYLNADALAESIAADTDQLRLVATPQRGRALVMPATVAIS